MKYINEEKIDNLLTNAGNATKCELNNILLKAKQLKRLSLKETAALLTVNDSRYIKRIFDTASYVKDMIYGRRIVLFAPLYISNICANSCLYCAFKSDNALINRKTLSIKEIKKETRWLLKRGHKRILMVAGESAAKGRGDVDYYTEAVNAIYSVNAGVNRIRRVNVNCAPLTVEEFKKLKSAGIGTYQLFQETYHDRTYRYVHPRGPKSDPDNRITAIDKAFSAGIDDVGIGVLYGLYDYRFETLAMLMHVEHLEERFNVGPHTISVPRVEPAFGAPFSVNTPYKVSDEDFKKVVAILRLSVPYTGIILSTRETAEMRDELFNLGVSQISAESNTSPGGYSLFRKKTGAQFDLYDKRSLDEIIHSLIKRKFIPSFCAACYRKERTGEAFMKLAKPGNIKDKCSINALVTMKEYMDDFASDKVKRTGDRLLKRASNRLDGESKKILCELIKEIDSGARDKYI